LYQQASRKQEQEARHTMAHYTLVRGGKVLGTKALTDAMAARLEARGTHLIPVESPVTAWVPGRTSKQQRLAQERLGFHDTLAIKSARKILVAGLDSRPRHVVRLYQQGRTGTGREGRPCCS
jgi:hypothetical protein